MTITIQDKTNLQRLDNQQENQLELEQDFPEQTSRYSYQRIQYLILRIVSILKLIPGNRNNFGKYMLIMHIDSSIVRLIATSYLFFLTGYISK